MAKKSGDKTKFFSNAPTTHWISLGLTLPPEMSQKLQTDIVRWCVEKALPHFEKKAQKINAEMQAAIEIIED